MESVTQPWWLTIPIEILRGLEATLAVPPEGQILLAKADIQAILPAKATDSSKEFDDAMSGADNAPDARRGLAECIAPHLAVLSGIAGQDSEFARWVLAQTPWVYTLKDEDFVHYARWPRLQGLSIHQSHISGKAFENLAEALPDFRRLKLINNRPRKPYWEELTSLKTLEELDVAENSFDDEYVDVLLSLPRLKRLELPAKALSPAAIGRLAEHPTIESLWVSPIDDGTLVALAGAKSLRSIRTYRPTVTDDGFKRMAERMSTLRELLFTSASKITDAGIDAIAAMPQLTRLYLSGAKITNAGVERLSQMKSLVELDIGGCSKVNDKAAAALAEMKNLKMLRITGTKITPQGLGVIGRGLGKGCNLVTKG